MSGEILDYDGTRLHYRSPTEHGSPGSPVFDNAWRLIALHGGGSVETPRLHGVGVYAANEGIHIDALRRALGAWREDGSPGD